MIPKVNRYRSEAYLRYVRGQDSVLSWVGPATSRVMSPRGSDPVSVSHHVRLGGNGGVGIKPSDYRTVPLSDLEHKALHQHGERSFWRKAEIDPDVAIISLLTAYCSLDPKEVWADPTRSPNDLIEWLEAVAHTFTARGSLWLHHAP